SSSDLLSRFLVKVPAMLSLRCIAAVAVFCCLCGCYGQSDVEELARAVTRFSKKQIQSWVQKDNWYYSLSPLSSHITISFLHYASVGDTRQRLGHALEVETITDPHEIYHDLLQELNSSSCLSVFNRMWTNPSFYMYPMFLNGMLSFFSAPSMNFIMGVDTQHWIDQWLYKLTNHTLEHLIRERDITLSTNQASVNVLMLNTTWSTPFLPENTVEGNFTVEKNYIVVPAYFMRRLGFFQTKDLGFAKVVRFPLKNPRFSFYIVTSADMPKLERTIAREDFDLSSLFDNMTTSYVDLSLPRLNITVSVDLQDDLDYMNCSSIYRGNAQFFRMTDVGVWVGKTITVYSITVDESGLVVMSASSAITGYGMNDGEPTPATNTPESNTPATNTQATNTPESNTPATNNPATNTPATNTLVAGSTTPTTYTTDSPFLYFVADDKYKMILFQGKVRKVHEHYPFV
ncbi:Serine Protease inhibitor, partial [Biomphalaria glabrata]